MWFLIISIFCCCSLKRCEDIAICLDRITAATRIGFYFAIKIGTEKAIKCKFESYKTAGKYVFISVMQ